MKILYDLSSARLEVEHRGIKLVLNHLMILEHLVGNAFAAHVLGERTHAGIARQADKSVQHLQGNLESKTFCRAVPRNDGDPLAVDKRSIHVKNHGFNHAFPPHTM